MKSSYFRILKSLDKKGIFEKVKYVKLALSKPNAGYEEMQKVYIVDGESYVNKVLFVFPIEVKTKHVNLDSDFSVHSAGEFYEFCSSSPQESLYNFLKPIDIEVDSDSDSVTCSRPSLQENQCKYIRVYTYQRYWKGELAVECVCETETLIGEKSNMENHLTGIKKTYKNVEASVVNNYYVFKIKIVS